MKTASEKLNNLAKPSNWKEKLNYQIENEAWLDKSADIAFSVLETLEELGKSQTWLAEQLGVSRQHVSKIVKGSENLSLKAITKLEQVLGIKLLKDQEEELTSDSISASKDDIKKTFDDVFADLSPEEKIEQFSTVLSMRFLSEIDEVMQNRPVKKKELAEKVQTSAAYITQLLRGDRKLKFEMLAKIAFALDIDFDISLKNKFDSEIKPPKSDGHGLWFYRPFKDKDNPKSDAEYKYSELESENELSVA